MTTSYCPGRIEKATVGGVVYQPVTAIKAPDKQGIIINYCPPVNGKCGAGVRVTAESGWSEALPLIG